MELAPATVQRALLKRDHLPRQDREVVDKLYDAIIALCHRTGTRVGEQSDPVMQIMLSDAYYDVVFTGLQDPIEESHFQRIRTTLNDTFSWKPYRGLTIWMNRRLPAVDVRIQQYQYTERGSRREVVQVASGKFRRHRHHRRRKDEQDPGVFGKIRGWIGGEGQEGQYLYYSGESN